jgi:hypothetical protein
MLLGAEAFVFRVSSENIKASKIIVLPVVCMPITVAAQPKA